MGLSFRDVVSTPRRNDKPDTLRCQPSLGLSFLCSERTTSLQDPPLRSGEKPIPLRCSTPTAFCLTPSLNLLSQPFLIIAMLAFSVTWRRIYTKAISTQLANPR